jgi:hypothetical protein
MRLIVEQKAVEKAPFSKATGFGVRLLHEFVGRSSARAYKEGQEK